MSMNWRNIALFAVVALLIVGTGTFQSWNLALAILNMGLISAIMALGVNMQWGYAGLFNVGIMGFAALGGLGVVITAMPPVSDAWAAGGLRALGGLVVGALVILGGVQIWKRMAPGKTRTLVLLAELVIGFFLFRWVFDAGVDAIEAVNPAGTGYLGGLGLPVILAWPVGGALAAAAAWAIGKTALGLRSDYLAIATLGISEIIIAVLKNEEWLSRGVKNVNGLPRPVPYEINLQNNPSFVDLALGWGMDPTTFSSIVVKLAYAGLFAVVLLILIWMSEMALNSPWGRMMRAIRDNETAAEAMGKDVTRRHLQIFVIGSAVVGLAGAMMTTLDGQLTPSSYQPLRYTFLIWVMVIVGGSGNNWGAVLGGFVIWFFWVQVEPMGNALMGWITASMPEGDLKSHLLSSAAHMRLLTMGLILLLVLRFSPRGLIPEK
ncbi:branched-chain amino acid ABC transporter permease [Maritimibacter sp. DP1N21-5]|uniref:branched-chain amino acid ABC transporter permease n=1 Tax=Maritimibacter sp. DP1N21-5 TaxID=2836867 RepID=UPI001C44FF16|nr:branched-chain amino acid ABC transporter permease [Maritimibacter sp. DP1N21-5]MBV7409938.1 branched-chain amino acid ABC transporter permease [Maritimibacter sp. DP1N21-5]